MEVDAKKMKGQLGEGRRINPSDVYTLLEDSRYPDKIINLIKSGEYVSFGDLLKLSTGQELKDDKKLYLAISADGNIKQKNNDEKRRHPNLGRATWQSVFDSWVRLTTSFKPELTIPLGVYRSILSELERKYMMTHPNGFMTYDLRFRLAVDAMIKMNARHERVWEPIWDELDRKIEDQVFLNRVPSSCVACGATTHTTEDCTPNLAATAAMAVSKAAMLGAATANTTCYGYNKMFGTSECTKHPCMHEHTCNGCRGDHPVTECPLRPKTQTKKPVEKKE
jgi:hypothetical protein